MEVAKVIANARAASPGTRAVLGVALLGYLIGFLILAAGAREPFRPVVLRSYAITELLGASLALVVSVPVFISLRATRPTPFLKIFAWALLAAWPASTLALDCVAALFLSLS